MRNILVISLDDNTFVMAGNYVNVGTKCPHCKKWSKTPIKIVKCECQYCKKEYDFNIMEENKEKYDAEIAKEHLWIMIKVFNEEKKKEEQKYPGERKDAVVFHVRDHHMSKARILQSLLKIFGIEMDLSSVSSPNRGTGRTMIVNEVTFRKSEDFKYYIERRILKGK